MTPSREATWEPPIAELRERRPSGDPAAARPPRRRGQWTVQRAGRAIWTLLTGFLTGRARLLRFVCVGVGVTVAQLGLLLALAPLALAPLVANILALLLAAQLNFALSSAFTWGDRPSHGWRFARRWLRFMASIAGTLLVNLAIFAVARLLLPTLLASALGSGLTGSLNFVLGDRFVFLG